MDYSKEEIDEFKTEALELLDEAESSLLKIENINDFDKAYSSIFRAFHSVKGGAGMLGFDMLKEHVHKLENIFQSLKSEIPFQSKSVSFFLNGVDSARKLIEGSNINFNYEIKDTGTQHVVKGCTKIKDDRPIIYIIDDEEDIIEILSELLEVTQTNINTFTSPLKAITNMENQLPDLILCDINMPEMNGFDVLKKIKSIDTEIPLIFISAHLDKMKLMEAINVGVFGVIDKPFNENIVLTLVSQALNRRKMWRILNRSIDLVLFQLSDMEKYLHSQGKSVLVEGMRNDAKELLQARRSLRKT